MSSCTPHHRVPPETNHPLGRFRSIPVDLVLLRHVRIHQECGLSQCMVCVSITSSAASLLELINSGTSFPFCTFTRHFTSYRRASSPSNARMVGSCSRSESTSTFDECREEFTETYAGLTRTYSTYHCPYTSFESTEYRA
jgi:hypothetical protein